MEETTLKKVFAAFMALVMILSLTICAAAEENAVNAQITFTTEDDTPQSIYAPEIPAGTLSAEVFGFDAAKVYAVGIADTVSVRVHLGSTRMRALTPRKTKKPMICPKNKEP